MWRIHPDVGPDVISATLLENNSRRRRDKYVLRSRQRRKCAGDRTTIPIASRENFTRRFSRRLRIPSGIDYYGGDRTAVETKRRRTILAVIIFSDVYKTRLLNARASTTVCRFIDHHVGQRASWLRLLLVVRAITSLRRRYKII